MPFSYRQLFKFSVCLPWNQDLAFRRYVLCLLLQILSHPPSRREHGYDAVVLLALLVNYRKYEVGGSLVYRCLSCWTQQPFYKTAEHRRHALGELDFCYYTWLLSPEWLHYWHLLLYLAFTQEFCFVHFFVFETVLLHILGYPGTHIDLSVSLEYQDQSNCHHAQPPRNFFSPDRVFLLPITVLETKLVWSSQRSACLCLSSAPPTPGRNFFFF